MTCARSSRRSTTRCRAQHQARQIAAGAKADNYLKLEDISNFERPQLKDAFTVVQSLHSVLARYRM